MDNVNFNNEAKNLSKEITNFLSIESINAIAREIGFVERDSPRFDGFKFLDMLLFTEFNHKELSLNSMALQFQERYGIMISKQAVCWRFSDLSVKFFKLLLEKVLRINVKNKDNIDFTNFKKVRIKDSTAFKLPENMKDKYPKSAKSTTIAQIRIQFEFDIKSGEILDISLQPFKNQDVIDAINTLDDIKPDELVIRDLGYVKIDVLRRIEEKGAFYLNRLSFTTHIFEKKNGEYQRLDLGKIHKNMRCNKISRISKDVYIGQKDKFKTKIIIELLPEKEYQKRLLKAKRNESRKALKHSYEFKAQLGLNVLITNTEIPVSKVRVLYTLRWQIELMFKIWKSIGEINMVRKMKVERFETYLFARLLWVALNWKVMRRIIACFFNEKGVFISPSKLFKTFKAKIMKFRAAISEGIKSVIGFINEMFKISPYYHKSEKKKHTITWSYDVMRMF